MPETVSFLDTTFKGLRCQNPACQAEAMQYKRITLRALLFTGWECHYCKLVHTGALVTADALETVREIGEGLISRLEALEAEYKDRISAKKKTAKKTPAKKKTATRKATTKVGEDA